MSIDYPKANNHLAIFAKRWADGEISHESWRRERRRVVRQVLAAQTDWQGEVIPLPGSKPKQPTLPAMPVEAAAAKRAAAATPLLATPSEAVHDEVLLLAVLLVAAISAAVILLYVY